MVLGLVRGGGVRPRRVRENLPLSPNEERYVLAETMTGQAYMSLSATRILGKVDTSRLQDFIQATCDRHEARRTGFEASGSGRFTKYVEDRARVQLKTLSMPGASDEALRAAVRAHIYARGDLSAGNLHRFLLIEVGPEDHIIGIGLHHATSDGVTSTAFMVETFSRLFGLEINAEPPQYSDFWDFDWRNSDAYKTAEAFWLQRMAGMESAGAWPADRADTAPVSVRPGVRIEIAPDVIVATQRAAESVGASHFTFFYAVYMVLLARLTGAERVATTFQSAGRRGKPGADQAHGVFSNSLILGTRVDETETIGSLASRLRTEIREAIAHEIFPYHHVIRSTGVHPRFAINWYPPSPSGGVDGITFTGIDIDENQDDDDLNLRFSSYRDAWQLVAYYDPAAFSAERVQAMGEQLIALAAAFARDVDAPIQAVRSADLARPGVLPDPAAPLAGGGQALIHSAFLERARETPQAAAIVYGALVYSYADLERGSRALAQQLRTRGIAAGDRVAILAERGPALVCAILAVARLGGVFVVLDSAHPEPRLASLVEIAAPRAILLAGGKLLAPLAERLAGPARATVVEAGVIADGSRATASGLDEARPDDPAYILFTSGSTGRPKGVAAAHRPLVHFLSWQAETFELTAADRVTMLSGLSHDPLLRDIFAPLSRGATLVIPDQATILEPGALARWLRDAKATVAHLTPAVGQILAAETAKAGPLDALRLMFWGGDLLRPSLLAALAPLTPSARHVNVYGCTETPQVAGFFRFDGDLNWASVPIGAGVEGVQLLVVDEAKRPVGIGELGEIAVRSNFLSLGYVEAGRIVAPSDRGADGQGAPTIYYTGDRGLYLPNGAVLMVGRDDDQVKILGHRVELAEVTAALLARPQVRAAVALAVGEDPHRRIVGFVAGPRRSAFDSAEMRESLADRLPAHMAPHDIRWVETLPLLPNGKVDRAALIAEAEAEAEAAPRVPARPPTVRERELMDRWAGVLGRAGAITPQSTFANLGGDSLSYVQAYLATEEVIGETPEGWQLMTIAELSAAAKPGAKGWNAVDMPILLRAASIFLVVAGHLRLFQYGGGATTSLLLVSGVMFGGLQLPEAYSRASPRPAFRWLWKLFVPTMLFSIALFSVKALAGKAPNISTLLLAADFQDYSRLSGPYWGGHEFYLWFIHCLLQILAILAVGLAVVGRLDGFRSPPMRFAWTLFLAGCVGRFVIPAFFYVGFFRLGAHPLATVGLLPTTHLSTFMLGVLIVLAATRREKAWVVGALVAYAALTATTYSPQQALILLVGGLALLAARQVPLPRPAAMVVFALSGGSLFIYLTHFMARSALRFAHAPEWPALQVAVAIGAGVGVWWAWGRGSALVARLYRRPAMAEPQAAI